MYKISPFQYLSNVILPNSRKGLVKMTFPSGPFYPIYNTLLALFPKFKFIKGLFSHSEYKVHKVFLNHDEWSAYIDWVKINRSKELL